MINLANVLVLFRDYGLLGLNIAQFIFLIWITWKITTNHLRHIQDAIDSSGKVVKVIREELGKTNDRLTKVETKVDIVLKICPTCGPHGKES